MAAADQARIVVMGGSFNPPTIAHLRLMEAAIAAVGAQAGVFVPVGEAYLKRKMRKSEDHIRLNEQTRLDMLHAMCCRSERLRVCDLEILNPLLHTKDTMRLLQDRHPGARLFFIAGADKLPLIGSWAEKTDFFEHFGIVLFAREGMDTETLIGQDIRLSPHAQSFIHVRQPEGMEGISSTAVRRLIAERKADQTFSYLHEGVFGMVRRLTPEDFPPEIERFQDEYAFLSNSFPSPIRHDGLTFSCAEAAFQAARCLHDSDKQRIAQGDGARAKRLAAKIEPPHDWDDRKLPVMEEILRAKFTQNPQLAQKLAATGNAVLLFGGKDRFWGKDLYTNQGENRLGQLLMKLRTELQDKTECDKR